MPKEKNFTTVNAVILDDQGRTECMIKLDANDVEMIAFLGDAELDAEPIPWPYRVFMKSGVSFFVDKRSGDVLENRWLGIKP